MKRLFAVCAALAVLAAGLCVPAFAVQSDLPALPADTCVVDDANILSAATESYLDTLNGTLQTDCEGATFAVLTVQYTGSVTTEQFATDAFNEWGVGAADENNGVLLLLVMESPNYADGDYYMALGSGFNNTDLDKQVSVLLQTYTEPDFAGKDYDSAVTKTADAVAEVIAEMYGVSLNSGSTGGNTGGTQPAPGEPGGYYEADVGNGGASVLTLIFDLIVLVLVFCLLILPIGRGLGWGWGPFGWHWGPFGWFGAWWVGPRPWYTRRGPGPRGPRGPHGPGGPLGGGPNSFHGGPRPPRSGGMGGGRPPRSGMGGGGPRPSGGSFGGGAGRSGGSFGGSRGGMGGGSRGGFGGMGGGGSRGGGGGRGR